MRYIIYIDKVLLIDFVTGTYILLLTGQTYGLKRSPVRILVSAAAGAVIFAIFLLLPGIGMIPGMLLQITCVNPLLLKAAFSFRTKEAVVKAYACMNGYGLLLGGTVLAMSGYLTGMQKDMGMRKVLSIVTLTTFLTDRYLRFRRKRKRDTGRRAVRLDFYGEILSCTGLVDSGNSLYEPYGKRPVSVLEKQVAGDLVDRVPQEKRYLIPFHSIGKKHGLLTAVELPWMEVEDQEQKKVFRKVVVAFSEETLTGKKDYQVILHPEFVRQEE